MNRFGTTLGQWLYWLLLILQLLLLLAFLAGGALLLLGLFSPDVFATQAVTVNGRAVNVAEAGLAPALGLVILGATLFGAFVVQQLIGIMRSVADGSPFVALNVRRLQAMAGAFVLLMLAKLALPALLPETLAGPARMGTALDLGHALMALLLLVLAEVFRAGVTLREDAEGTV